ncbi:glycosyltransferase family 32 protein [Thermothelomyces thermophilus ATCC 42464]|uniref:Glycosyltransferase family 32 protein n=1 Tax=Thermothelomyces thermophilus (strain ATCC 42464 / BCRC 31852 / DSM 1799) TaxID=573729 RepID=G2QLS1_THET4|nr:glycosyltransferase family 32 protein [Thermothelomyces thermophilus ATCC 42464]AEO60901.1 glycosyltransferase family 32 protein [Thermothelomyces thermophilus ATCC 42464]
MVAKLGSPLGKPSLAATTAQFRNCLPAQFRRVLPLYVAAICLVLFVFNLNLFPSSVPISRPAVPAASVPQVRNEFPRKIWQTWKVNPLKFEERDLNTARTWLAKNPDYRYEVLTDDNDMRYVEYHFGPNGFNRPDIVEFYRGLKAAIVKADLLRYMIMYAEGGIYADIDVEALKPASKFIPARFDEKDIDMVVGVEIDEPDWKDHPILGPKSRSFCQWTFMCKPQLPVMMRLIEQIMTWLNGVAKEQGVTIGEVNLDFDQIISGTGPSAFTEAIMAEMEQNKEDPNLKIDWDLFHDLDESKVVSRVLVLTVEAFAAGQGHSHSGTHDSRAALVRHHYHASNWPSRHPRYSHPAYGEVERCNWNPECVRTWDKNVEAFSKLSDEEKAKIIEQKQKEKEEEEKKRKAEEEQRRKAEEEKKKKQKEEEKKKKEAEEAERKKKEEEEASKEKEKEKAEGQQKEQEPEQQKKSGWFS